MGTYDPSDARDEADRIRRLEDGFIRFDEWAKVWNSLPARVAVLEQEKTQIWAAIGQFKVKQGLIWVIVASIAGLAASIVGALITGKLTGK